eukprot:519066_1
MSSFSILNLYTIYLIATVLCISTKTPPSAPTGWIVSTLAGSGPDGETEVYPCKFDPESHRDGPADKSRWASPTRAQVVNGIVYAMDGMNGCIRSIINGTVSSVTPCCTTEESEVYIHTGPAGNGPQDMHVTEDGKWFYLMSSYNHQLMRSPIPYTKWEVLAGNGSRPYRGRSVNGPALENALNEPHGMAVTNDGSGDVYIAETYSSCIRLLRNGTLTTIAGKCGYGGHTDGAPFDARFQHMHHVNLDPRNESNLYVSDVECWDDNAVSDVEYESCNINDNGVCFSGIRKIELDRITGMAIRVSTLAGQATYPKPNEHYATNCNFHRDGNVSLAAFNYIHGTAFLPLNDVEKKMKAKGIELGGSNYIYVCDEDNNMIRRVDLNMKVVETLAGTGKTGHVDGDGGHATFWEPGGLGLGPDGRIYVGGYKGQRIRMITPPANYNM